MNTVYIISAILTMAVVTYLIRALPLAVFRKKIENLYIKSFLEYIPYAVLAAMTFPQILYSAGPTAAGITGLIVVLILAYQEKSLLTVAAGASIAAFLAGQVIKFIS